MCTSHTVERATELLAFVFASRPEVKRTRVRQWLKHGSIHVNGQPATYSDHPLQAGDTVEIRPTGIARGARLLPLDMKVVFEDASLIVIDKPENLLSVANAKEREQTAYAFLTDYVRRGGRHRRERVWIVHRLDRETSGLMVFARTEASKLALQAHWSTTDKRYLAVVEGRLPADHGVLSSHLDESNAFKVYSARASERTRHAVTHYRVVKHVTNRSLVELTPKTGRRNQLRVHLADAGCPIVGDRKYEARTDPARRLGLHATFLQFTHPLSGAVLKFESCLPRALARLV